MKKIVFFNCTISSSCYHEDGSIYKLDDRSEISVVIIDEGAQVPGQLL